MRAYYNDNDKKICAWLSQLIKNGDITKGDIDDRSIEEVTEGDIKGYDRVHLFAGIAGWDHALNKTGWRDEPVLTASLPCQPFSSAGKRKGKEDERHLLPHAIKLIKKSGITTCFGEQVPGAIKLGWLDDLYAEMEASGYSVGSIIAGAHSVGQAHIRQRLYWVANSKSERIRGISLEGYGAQREAEESRGQQDGESSKYGSGSAVSRMANSNKQGLQGRRTTERAGKQLIGANGLVVRMGDSQHKQHEGQLQGFGETSRAEEERKADELAGPGEIEWLYCQDGKYRPIKPGIEPLVNGLPRGMVHSSDSSITPNDTQEARVMRIKGYGNAIQVDLATEFIKSFLKTRR